MNVPLSKVPITPKYSNKLDAYNNFIFERLNDIPYYIENANGDNIFSGKLDESGRTIRLISERKETFYVMVGDIEIFDDDDFCITNFQTDEEVDNNG